MTDGQTPESEPTPQSLPFREMAINYYKTMAGGRKPVGITPAFVATSLEIGKLNLICIGANIEPPLMSRSAGWSDWIVFDVNSARTSQLPSSEREKDINKRRSFFPFEVYDFDVDKLSDPTVVDDFKPISPTNILVPSDSTGAQALQSWVIDPHVRSRVNEYYRGIRNQKRPDGKAYGDVEKYIKLRNAATAKFGFPGHGEFTYQQVKVEATGKVSFRMFTEDDLAWLETYMTNKGIPIPQDDTFSN